MQITRTSSISNFNMYVNKRNSFQAQFKPAMKKEQDKVILSAQTPFTGQNKIETLSELIEKINPPENAEIVHLHGDSFNQIIGIRIVLSDKYPKYCYDPVSKDYDTLGRLRKEVTEDGEIITYDKYGNITELYYWTEGCKQGGGGTTIKYNPADGTYKKEICDPYRRTLEEGTYTPLFPVDDDTEDALPIYRKYTAPKSDSPIVGSKNFDDTVNAPTGTDMSTLDVPTGTRLYYGGGDLRNGTRYNNPYSRYGEDG